MEEEGMDTRDTAVFPVVRDVGRDNDVTNGRNNSPDQALKSSLLSSNYSLRDYLANLTTNNFANALEAYNLITKHGSSFNLNPYVNGSTAATFITTALEFKKVKGTFDLEDFLDTVAPSFPQFITNQEELETFTNAVKEIISEGYLSCVPKIMCNMLANRKVNTQQSVDALLQALAAELTTRNAYRKDTETEVSKLIEDFAIPMLDIKIASYDLTFKTKFLVLEKIALFEKLLFGKYGDREISWYFAQELSGRVIESIAGLDKLVTGAAQEKPKVDGYLLKGICAVTVNRGLRTPARLTFAYLHKIDLGLVPVNQIPLKKPRATEP